MLMAVRTLKAKLQRKRTLTLSDPGYFRQLTIRGGGGFKNDWL